MLTSIVNKTMDQLTGQQQQHHYTPANNHPNLDPRKQELLEARFMGASQAMSMMSGSQSCSSSGGQNTPNHNCDSNLSTASAGSFNSDKESADLTPEKVNQRGSSVSSSSTNPINPSSDRKRRKKDLPAEEWSANGSFIFNFSIIKTNNLTFEFLLD